jgi:hypothetical protein
MLALFTIDFISLWILLIEDLIINQRPCMDEQQAIANLKNGNLAGLEFLVHRYQVQAVHSAYLITCHR